MHSSFFLTICSDGLSLCPWKTAQGQQQLKLGEKDIKETLRIQGSGKVLFLDTEPAAKISVLAKGQSGFAQNVQVERGHIFAGSGCVLVKNGIQAPMESAQAEG